MDVRELGDFGEHGGDDADVPDVDASVVQVVRKGLTVHRGRRVVKAIPDKGQVGSLTQFYSVYFSKSRIDVNKKISCC